MRWLYRVFIFLSVIPIQTLLLENLRLSGVKPDLALVFVFVQGWIWGAKTGFYWGIALGGLIDLFSFGVFSITLALKGAVGLLAGILGRSFLHLSLQAYVVIFFMFSTLHDLAGNFFLHGIRLEEFQSVRIRGVMIRAVYNTLLSLGCILFLRVKKPKGGIEYGGTLFSPGKKQRTGK